MWIPSEGFYKKSGKKKVRYGGQRRLKMEYTELGKSGIKVSRLCLGCMSFGDPASKMHAWTLGPEESEAIIRHALGLGINFFDTANCYSGGTSEEYLGRAIRNQSLLQRREAFKKGDQPRDRRHAATVGNGLS